MTQLLSAKALRESFPDATIESKNYLIEMWSELVYIEKGKNPTPYELSGLADWLLEDELKDVSRSKVQNTEYPILSKSQIKIRYRELSMTQELVDILHQKRVTNQPTKKADSKNNEY